MFYLMGMFFCERGADLKMVTIFTHTCPNHSGVGAIDSADYSEQVFDSYYIQEVYEKNSRMTF